MPADTTELNSSIDLLVAAITIAEDTTEGTVRFINGQAQQNIEAVTKALEGDNAQDQININKATQAILEVRNRNLAIAKMLGDAVVANTQGGPVVAPPPPPVEQPPANPPVDNPPVDPSDPSAPPV